MALFLSSCAYGLLGASQLAIGAAQWATTLSSSSDGTDSNKNALIYGDTKEIVIKKIGNPTFAINIDNNKEVLYYTMNAETTVMIALVDNIYRENFMASTKSVEDYRQRGALESGAKKLFRSFREETSPYDKYDTADIDYPGPTSP